MLRGTVKADQNKTYIEVPFRSTCRNSKTQRFISLPRQRRRYDTRYRRPGSATLSRLEQQETRVSFTISTADATPSYLPGNIPPGMWKLLVGVPNIRQNSVASYEADFYFELAGRNTRPEGFQTRLCFPLLGGIAAICTCTPRTATVIARARLAGRCHARYLLPPFPGGGREGLGFCCRDRPQHHLALRCSSRTATILRPSAPDSWPRDHNLRRTRQRLRFH